MTHHNLKDETGNRYGRLVVLEKHPEVYRTKSGTVALWRCQCDCGNIAVIRGSYLRSGHTKSCGCLNRLPPGESVLNIIYDQYRRRAEKKGRAFQITKEDFRKLSQMDCHYCGSGPRITYGKKWSNGTYTYNGLDRIDNDGEYTLDNVVPCCFLCNRSKGEMSVDEFKVWLMEVYRNFIMNGERDA